MSNNQQQQQLIQDGYTKIPRGVLDPHKVSSVRTLAEMLVANGHDPAKVWLHDEAWDLLQHACAALKPVLGDHLIPSGDIVLFYRQHGREFLGFKGAHRDMPDAGPDTFDPTTNMPGSCVLWISLTDATPDQSCLCVIPKQHDDGYMQQGLCMQDVVRSVYDVTKIHPVPTVSGECIVLGHRVLHWGTEPVQGAPPRIALSFVLVDPRLIPTMVNRRLDVDSLAMEERTLLLHALWVYYFDHHAPSSTANLSTLKHRLRTWDHPTLYNPWFRERVLQQTQHLRYVLTQLRPATQRQVRTNDHMVREPVGLEDLEYLLH